MPSPATFFKCWLSTCVNNSDRSCFQTGSNKTSELLPFQTCRVDRLPSLSGPSFYQTRLSTGYDRNCVSNSDRSCLHTGQNKTSEPFGRSCDADRGGLTDVSVLQVSVGVVFPSYALLDNTNRGFPTENISVPVPSCSLQ